MTTITPQNPVAAADVERTEPDARAEALFIEVRDALMRSDVDAATNVIRSMERQMDRDVGYGGVSEYLSQAGTFESVFEMLSHIENVNAKDDTLVRIAEARHDLGKHDEARTYLFHIEDLDLRDKEAERLGIVIEGGE